MSSRPFAIATLVVLFACSSKSSAPQAPQPTPTLAMNVHVPAGTEAFKCQYFTVADTRTFASKVSHKYTTGSHHLTVFRTDLTSLPAGSDKPQDCWENGADFMSHVRGFVYASQVAEDALTLPDGVGFAFATSDVLLMQSHYLNATSQDLDATVSFYVTPVDDVQQTAATLFWYDTSIYVPAGGTAKATMHCPVQKDVNVLRVVPHTHARGSRFTAFLDPPGAAPAAQPFYTSTDWEHPATSPAPFVLKGGTQLRIACEYDNAHGTQDYYQGQSASTNEMCAMFAVYYPDMGISDGLCFTSDGVGTGACGDLLDCHFNCAEQHSSDIIGESDCVQKCNAQSCASAPHQLGAVRHCADTSCTAECATGGATCLACVNQKCAAEVATCKAATCN